MNEEHFLEPVGRLFYIVSPNRTTFKRYSDVPDYIGDAVPYLLILFFLEICASIYTKRSKIRLNDTIACFSHGILMELAGLFVPGGQFILYMYIYRYYRLVTLPLDSVWTWWFCFLAFDFLYYWGHRASHGINILWATHHVHHSSEDFNISTNVRQSILQHIGVWTFYLPLALFIPGPLYIVHAQLGYLYQFWIHTEVIKSLGPLEYILNTPSHHRVHHGRNRNSIDKNFGGTLIIWDKLFGTFQSENEEILYGLTTPVNSFDLFKIQFDHCVHMWKTFWSQKGVIHKLSVLFKGPGWSPGKPWHGEEEDIPNVKAPVKKYDVQLLLWTKLYLTWHFIILIQGHLAIMESYDVLPRTVRFGVIFYEIFSLAAIGFLLDKRSYFAGIELIRCLMIFLLNYCFLHFLEENENLTKDFSIIAMQSRWFPEKLILMTYQLSLFTWISVYIIEASIKGENVNFGLLFLA